ncbi:HNH endonuclease signature motif containing protein [Pantoea agglomerans]|uniref:HNH endonuclease signature motif containing protein n=1 Tax=Enterobacter agglomerans TaxID=549 RepID=UPI00026D2354|nr:HNH endonuclease signature motif containing protein [Pantoea agglomerans]
MAIQFETSGNLYVLSRSSYTRKVWKANHHAFGHWTPGCWNTVHYGSRDGSYKQYHSMARTRAMEITGLTINEFQYLFEKLDAAGTTIYIKDQELRFYAKGGFIEFTPAKKGEIRDILKKLDLYGDADAERKIGQAAAKAKAASEKADKRAKGVALARSLGLLPPDAAPVAEEETAPVAEPEAPAGNAVLVMDGKRILKSDPAIKYGCPPERVLELRAWQGANAKALMGIKLKDVIAMFLGTYEEPAEETQPEAATEPKARKPRKRRTLLEEREAKADMPFYGMRRRSQAQFRDDVALNCGDRCVVTGASLLRCEAAHLVAHARKGGASFKNGLLLRADLHTLFDHGQMAVHPADLTVWFHESSLALDADLRELHGKKLRPTMKPIKAENLAERWEAFSKQQQVNAA